MTCAARIAGMGIVGALGVDVRGTLDALRAGFCGLKPLTQFAAAGHDPLPVGQAPMAWTSDPALPRTHQLARRAADQAMAGQIPPVDAVVMGTTTGGMALTETLLKSGVTDPAAFARHPLASVAEDLARRFQCRGPVLTVSTACSSGAVAVRMALELIRRGLARRVLAGGADSLCRLTYYGFKSLQLIDPAGARPLDVSRRGLSLAEAAAVLLLDAEADPASVAVLGGGLSCDAFHPVRPQPQGDGALAAMAAALADAGLGPEAVDYINLHGTGTVDNDLSEARAIRRLFAVPPPLSSIKGAAGHSLAAAGAVEAVAAALCVENGFVPGTVGLVRPDPALDLAPLSAGGSAAISTVLSNSFGFGGNNACLVIGRGAAAKAPAIGERKPLRIAGMAAVTGAGHTGATLDRLTRGLACKGRLDDEALCAGLPQTAIRRLRRLPRMALAVAEAGRPPGVSGAPDGVFFATAMGSLSETYAFLEGLSASGERFASPTDFIGSVHNAAAGQLALRHGATGANITVSGADASFAQALLAAELFTAEDATALVAAADEYHEILSPLIDASSAADAQRSDGGAALWLHRGPSAQDPAIRLLALAHRLEDADAAETLAARTDVRRRYDLMIGAAGGSEALARFARRIDHAGPILDLASLVGVFGAAPAVAAVWAAALVRGGRPPAGTAAPVRAVLLAATGPNPWAIEVTAA